LINELKFLTLGTGNKGLNKSIQSKIYKPVCTH